MSDCPHDENDTVSKTWRYKLRKVGQDTSSPIATWHYAGTDLEVMCDVGRPIDCIWGAWGDYGPCSKSCGGGVKLRTRMLAQRAKHGGSCSPSSTDLAECKTQECPAGNYSISNLAWLISTQFTTKQLIVNGANGENGDLVLRSVVAAPNGKQGTSLNQLKMEETIVQEYHGKNNLVIPIPVPNHQKVNYSICT